MEEIEKKITMPTDEANDEYSDDDLFKISSWGADLSFRELISRYDDDELVKPELQRNYVWDKPEASRFIDSILLGLPIPSIFLAKTKEEKLLIIDGFQRFMTVRDYVKGVFSKDNSVFKLSRTEKIHEKWRGKAFVELSEDEKRKIRNTTIHAIIFMQQHPTIGDTSLFQIFERINSSGRTLLPQEIRNCIYQGPINTLLFELNENQKWRVLWGSERRDDRMRDLEFILRFFALSDKKIFDEQDAPSRISLKKYLNQYMESVNKQSVIDDLRSRFNNTVDVVYAAFGISAFHNISSDHTKIIPAFSPTIYDSIMISVDHELTNKNYIVNIADFEKRKLDLLKDKSYQELLYQETMRVPNIVSRVKRMYESLYHMKW